MVLASRDNLSMRIIKMCVHAVVGGIILAHSAGTSARLTILPFVVTETLFVLLVLEYFNLTSITKSRALIFA